MDNKYFTSLNGYLVKDTDARNGVNEVNTKLNTTNTNVNNNKTNIATNTKEIASLKTSVTNVNAKADFNTANLESLQSSVNTVKIDNDKNKTDLALLNEKVNGIDGINAQLETTIERVTTAEENISTNTANIQNIQMGLNAVHTHDNKATLDKITASDIEKWNSNSIGEEVYKTHEEIKTNKVWIDGKPIYRQTISGLLANETVLATNVDKLIHAYGTGEVSGVIRTIPYYIYYNGEHYSVSIQKSPDSTDVKLSLYSGADTYKQVDAIIEYTKITE